MKKQIAIITILTLVHISTGSFLYAQSNETMDRILAREEIDYRESAYLVLSATGQIEDSASVDEALASLPRQNWDITIGEGEESLSLGEYSYLLMRALEIEGGIMYRLFPGPRYAARELSYLGLIPGEGAAGRTLSGYEAVQLLGRSIEWKEARR